MAINQEKAFHVSLKVRDLARSVEFYGRLFGVAPAKYFDDYAKFELDEPAVVLSLEPMKDSDRQGLDHLGIRLANRNLLIDATSRIAERGLKFEHVAAVDCCYSRQSKIYMNDPDGHLVEVYTVEADLADNRAAREHMGEKTSMCEVSDGVYNHLLPAKFPLAISAANASMSEINLRGTFNADINRDEAWRIIQECRRVLKPGGKISTHILVADKEIAGELPRLPEPASHVRRAPTEEQMQALFSEAGFAGIELKRFSHASVFGFAGAELREYLLEGSLPYSAVSEANVKANKQLAVYKGPFPSVTDELGNVYFRGARTLISTEAESLLRTAPYREHFVLLVIGGGC